MRLQLRAPDVSVTIDPDDGGRMVSFRVRGHELLGGVGRGAIEHGSFVMAPWAGRVRFGLLEFGDRHHQLPLRLPPHAAHGTVIDQTWAVASSSDTRVRLVSELVDPWPVAGSVTQDISVAPGSVTQTVTVETWGEPFPACIGWHPWFRRQLPAGGPLQMSFRADAMVVRDADGMPSDERAEAGVGPWDDCFVGMQWPVRLEWPGAVRLDIDADTAFAVLYNLRDEVWCVEPQTGPPNDVNDAPRWVTADQPLTATTTWAAA